MRGRIAELLVGHKYGRLTVLLVCDYRINRSKVVRCQCDCGNLKDVRVEYLGRGTNSCGCLGHERAVRLGLSCRKHGHCINRSYSKTYRIWQAMIQRCKNPHTRHYDDYGGRGIIVCERWECFDNFLHDMGERPGKMEIERLDNSLGYFPGNCKWATRKEQMRNTRRNRLLSFNGKTQCLSDWADSLGISRNMIYGRLNRGWTTEEALATPRITG